MWKRAAVELNYLEGAQVGGQLRAGSGAGLDLDEYFQSGKKLGFEVRFDLKRD